MADYRDDREALHERVTTLQQELDGARGDLERERAKGTPDERVENLGSELSAAKERLAAMEVELRALRGNKAPSFASVLRKNRTPIMVGASILFGAVVVLGLGRSRSAAVVPAPFVPPRPVETLAPPPRPTAAPAPAPPMPEPPTPKPEAAERTLKVTWPAQVRLSSGAREAVGSTCAIDAEVTDRGSLPSLRNVSVRCGEHVLYDSTKPIYGMREKGSSVAQETGKKPGTLVFNAQYKDTGTGDTPQLTIDGTKGTAYVWHDYPEAFRLELTFSRASTPIVSEPLGTLGRAAMDRSMRVRQVHGRAAPAVGTMCRLRAMPQSSRKCLVIVDCGAAGALFGGPPFSSRTSCNADDVASGKAKLLDLDDPQGSKDDEDPRLHFFNAPGAEPVDGGGVLTVADEPKAGGAWSVELVPVDPLGD